MSTNYHKCLYTFRINDALLFGYDELFTKNVDQFLGNFTFTDM